MQASSAYLKPNRLRLMPNAEPSMAETLSFPLTLAIAATSGKQAQPQFNIMNITDRAEGTHVPSARRIRSVGAARRAASRAEIEVDCNFSSAEPRFLEMATTATADTPASRGVLPRIGMIINNVPCGDSDFDMVDLKHP